MEYAAFVFWLFLILGMGVGIHRLWTQLVRPTWVHWALLPGTIVSETAYIFGCLITGGEIDQLKAMNAKKKKSGSSSGEKKKPRTIGPLISSLLAIGACAAAIFGVQVFLGEQVFGALDRGWEQSGELPSQLPTTWTGFWNHLDHLVRLQRYTCDAMVGLQWKQWQVVLFVYLTMCLAIRLTPMRGTARTTVAAVVLIVAGLAVAAALAPQWSTVLERIWPLLTYVWTSLLALLVISLVLRGAVAVFRLLTTRPQKDG